MFILYHNFYCLFSNYFSEHIKVFFLCSMQIYSKNVLRIVQSFFKNKRSIVGPLRMLYLKALRLFPHTYKLIRFKKIIDMEFKSQDFRFKIHGLRFLKPAHFFAITNYVIYTFVVNTYFLTLMQHTLNCIQIVYAIIGDTPIPNATVFIIAENQI